MSKGNINMILGLCAIFLLGAFVILRNYYEDQLLLNSKTTIGILVEKENGQAVHSTANGTFIYYVGKIKKTFLHSDNYSFMNIGDTVLIKYSLENVDIATVVDKYVMQKYKHLKYLNE